MHIAESTIIGPTAHSALGWTICGIYINTFDLRGQAARRTNNIN